MTARSRYLFYTLFALSGFSALIYESVWSHYMKLYLGHAAYAQTLVLAIFMAGMAIGSGLCSKYSPRWNKLLKIYAIVEGIIGIFSILFHDVFNTITQLSFNTIIYHLNDPVSAHAFKWALSAILILPQSILIGMPFPLMSTAIMRMFPQKPGKTLSMLYFTNSFGAAIGVLVCGFMLINAVGLPGTIRLAGVINIALALLVWFLAEKYDYDYHHENAPASKTETSKSTNLYRLLLIASFVTGAASFIYEIGWIRMLSLVMGSSTHAFELMLSAFIFGLAFGALWIQRRIDSIADPVKFLVIVQITMGLLALATIPIYGNSFSVMQWLMRTLSNTETGYHFFNLYSYGIALAVMLPTTFCAGITLPLITYALIKENHGEKCVGAVYAANTLGAIAGVIYAVHLGMPFFGLKGLIMLGGCLDLALGLGILWLTGLQTGNRRMLAALITLCVTAVLATEFLVNLDHYKMASGVYRKKGFFTQDQGKIIYYRDGKTATVSLTLGRSGTMSIRTNGKPDASINISQANRQVSPDEATMILAAAIPMGLHPQAKTVANIGLGSGLTAHTLLCNPSLQQVDTVEIEPSMVEAANSFRPRVNLTFTDPRSKIFIDDAKTFFSIRRGKYDIIISEPSNPWVSGIGGLFSEQFYQMINNHLNSDGFFVQWLQLYEIDANLVASVLKAMIPNFADFVAFAPNDAELFIVARKNGTVGQLNSDMFNNRFITSALQSVNINNLQDIEIRRIGNKKSLSRFVSTFSIRSNSDYYPVLDQNAARTRFMQTNALELLEFSHDPLPTAEMLNDSPPKWHETVITPSPYYSKSKDAFCAMAFRDHILTGGFSAKYLQIPHEIRQEAMKICQLFQKGGAITQQDDRIATLSSLAQQIPYLRPQEMTAIWKKLESGSGCSSLSSQERALIRLFKAVGNRDAEAMTLAAGSLLANLQSLPPEAVEYILAGAMLGNLAQGKREEAFQLWKRYGYKVIGANMQETLFRVLASNSAPD